jgi:serine/threonine protein phosphatase PrpC
MCHYQYRRPPPVLSTQLTFSDGMLRLGIAINKTIVPSFWRGAALAEFFANGVPRDPPNSFAVRWQVLGASVRGARHKRCQLPNQDAWQHYVSPDGLPPVIVAVSDGHGSNRCFRSDVGSRIAVEVAIELSRSCIDSLQAANLSEARDTFECRFPRHLISEWKQRVLRHASEQEFSGIEISQMAPANRSEVGQPVPEAHVLDAYGATLLLLIITQSYAVYLQLGDGEMLVVSEETTACGLSTSLPEATGPLPKDPQLIANETSSLCCDDALRRFRVRFQVLGPIVPSLFLICTDGYSNAFESPAGFQQTATDLLKALGTSGIETVDASFAEELEHVSTMGSGDDVTVVVVYRLADSVERESDEE